MTDRAGIIVVTIDGGAASGKSSTARALSERFGLLHVDTGAFYRTVTLALLRAGVRCDDAAAVEKALGSLKIATRVSGRSGRLAIGGEVPGAEIRGPEVNENVSVCAAQPAVRAFLLDCQRDQANVAQEHGFPGLVMEGRDIGSVIFPDADFRFFLEADEAERMRRRAKQGENDSIAERDKMDAGRNIAPLLCPEGAIRIDSTKLSLEEVVEKISGFLEQKLTRVPQP